MYRNESPIRKIAVSSCCRPTVVLPLVGKLHTSPIDNPMEIRNDFY